MKCLHQLLKGISLTGALFVFQACYGVPQKRDWMEEEAPMSFSLVSHETGAPLEGIRIYGRPSTTRPASELGVTDASGQCRVDIPYIMDAEGPYLSFEDPEGRFASKDTLIADLRYRDILIKMDSAR